jgi:hypothetical protein
MVVENPNRTGYGSLVNLEDLIPSEAVVVLIRGARIATNSKWSLVVGPGSFLRTFVPGLGCQLLSRRARRRCSVLILPHLVHLQEEDAAPSGLGQCRPAEMLMRGIEFRP